MQVHEFDGGRIRPGFIEEKRVMQCGDLNDNKGAERNQ